MGYFFLYCSYSLLSTFLSAGKKDHYRERRKILPKLPHSREESVSQMFDCNVFTNESEQFSFADKDGNSIVFTCLTIIMWVLFPPGAIRPIAPSRCKYLFFRMLSKAPTWLVDGTFNYAPAFFTQLYTIHVFINGFYLPLAFFCLPSNSEDTYKRMFQFLEHLASENNVILQPSCIMVDFERAAINAAKVEFARAKIYCCRFHLA